MVITGKDSIRERDKAIAALEKMKELEKKFSKKMTMGKIPKGYSKSTNPEKWKTYQIQGNIVKL